MLGRERGYSMTHQVIVDVREYGVSDLERRFHESNILVPSTSLLDDSLEQRSGLRISVQEVTRQGMMEPEMDATAELINRRQIVRIQTI